MTRRNPCCTFLWTALLSAVSVFLFPPAIPALDLSFSQGGVVITGGADYVLKTGTPDDKIYDARIWCQLASGDSLPTLTTVTTNLRLSADDTDVGPATVQTFAPADWTHSPSGYYIDLDDALFTMPLPGSSGDNLHTDSYYLSAYVKGDKFPTESDLFNNRADSTAFQYTVYSGSLVYDRDTYAINGLTRSTSSVCSGDTYLSAVSGNWTSSWWNDNFALPSLCAASGAASDGYSTDLTVIRDVAMAAMPPQPADPRWVIKGQVPENLRLDNIRVECEGSPPKNLTLTTRLLNRDNSDYQVAVFTETLTPAWLPDTAGQRYYFLHTPDFPLPACGSSADNLQTATYRVSTTAESIADAFSPNNMLATNDYGYTVYSGLLYFNDVETLFSSIDFGAPQVCGTIFEDNVRLDAVSGSWDDLSESYPVAASGLCAEKQDNSDGYSVDLHLLSGQADLGTLEATVAGLPVRFSQTTLDTTGGTFTSATVTLPEDISAHGEDNGLIDPLGTGRINFSGQTFSQNLEQVTLSTFVSYLHSYGQPFYLRSSAIRLPLENSGNGMTLLQPFPVYVHQEAEDALAPADPRTSFPANDIIFHQPSTTASNSISLDQDGLSGILYFQGDGGSLQTAFPRAQLDFDNLTIYLQENAISGGVLSNVSLTMEFGRSCRGLECSGNTYQSRWYQVSAPQVKVHADGTFGARFTDLGPSLDSSLTDTGEDSVEWGVFPRQDNNGTPVQLPGTYIRRDRNHNGAFLVPGFIMPRTADTLAVPLRLGQVLLGSYLFNDPTEPGIFQPLHDPEDPTATRGDGIFAGLNLGPEYYTTLVEGTGQLLDNQTSIRFFDAESFPSHAPLNDGDGVKYVLRPGGLTGVFNTGVVPSVPLDINVYGYNFIFDRFAFAQDRNQLDSNTFIDGSLALSTGPVANDISGNQQDFKVSFVNLDLTCDGNLGSGQVDSQAEPTWPACDDAGEHKTCQTLMYWNMPVLLTGIDFTYPPDQAAANDTCPTANRQLQLHTKNQIDGLSYPLNLSAFYSPRGVVHDQDFFGRVQAGFDRPVDQENGRGFNIRLRTAYLNQLTTDNNGDAQMPPWSGFSVLAGMTEVPLFDNCRLAGHFDNLDYQDRQSFDLYMFQDETTDDGNYDGVPDQYQGDTVPALRERLQNLDRAAPKPYFTYSWPTTDMVDLSSYATYQRSTEDRGPRFDGLAEESNILGVVEVSTVPDYITPKKTKLSFGLSADVAALKNFQLDIGNYTGDIDVFLHQTLQVDSQFQMSKILCATVDGRELCLNELEDSMLSVTGGDLSAAIGTELDTVLQQGGLETMIPDIARQLTTVHQAPAMIHGVLLLPVQELQTQLDAVINSDLSGQQFEIFYDQLSPVALYGVPALAPLEDAPDEATLLAWEEQVQVFRNNLNRITRYLDHSITELDQAENDAEAVIDQLSAATRNTLDALPGLKDLLTAQLENRITTGDPSVNPLFKQVEQARKIVRDTRLAIGAVDLEHLSAVLADAARLSGATIDTSLVSNIHQTVNSALNELDLAIAQADQVIGDTYADLLDEANGTLDEMISQCTQLVGTGSTLQLNLDQQLDMLDDIRTMIGISTPVIINQFKALQEALAALHREIDPEAPKLTVADGTDNWTAVSLHAQVKLNGAAESFAATLQESGGSMGVTVPDPANVDFLSLFGAGNFSILVNAPFDKFLVAGDDNILPTRLEELADAASSALPQPTADDLRSMLQKALLDSTAVAQLNGTYFSQFGLISEQLDNVTTQLTDRINELIRRTIEVVNEQLSAQLKAAVAPVGGWTALNSVGIDGYALISRDEIERIHMGADFIFAGVPDPTSYNAALDVFSRKPENGSSSCTGENGNYFDVILSTHDVVARMLGMSVAVKTASIGFTIDQSATPISIFGNCYLDGAIDYEPLALDDLGLEVGVGEYEGYFGATGSGRFDTYQIQRAAFYVGKSCPTAGQGVLQRLDPEVGRFIGDISPLTGIYVRGSADVPVWNNGCTFTIGLGAEVGAWYFTEPDPMGTVGALVGGSAYGRLGCLAALKGKITCMGQLSGRTYSFAGSGWAGAGTGDCSPGSWQSVSDVRHDRWCETGDATFKAAYDKGWDITDLSVNCCD